MRPIVIEDVEKLNSFREQFSSDGRIDIPFGYRSEVTDTVVIEKDQKTIGAVMGTSALIVDFMKDPLASGSDIYGAVLMGERALTYVAQKNGIGAAYCAIPSHLTYYIDMVRRSGYAETFQNCTILRRPLIEEQCAPTTPTSGSEKAEPPTMSEKGQGVAPSLQMDTVLSDQKSPTES